MSSVRYFIIMFGMFGFAMPSPISGQQPSDSVFTLIFRISAQEAEALYKPENPAFSDAFLHTPADSTMLPAKWRPSIPGHYVLVHARGEQLAGELRSFVPIYAQVLEDQLHFSLQVFDESGQHLSDAEVWLNDISVPYQPRLGLYQLPRYRKDGFLKISAKGETVFYRVENEVQHSPARQRWQRFRSSKVGRWVVMPGIVGLRLYQATKALFRGGNPRYYLRFGRKQKTYGGYMALNKPRFLPGDTVKVKAYVANHRHKPLRKPLDLMLYAPGKPTTTLAQIKPQSPGNYSYEFPLGDSLKLDNVYSLRFVTSHKKQEVMYGQFQYEDYQLDETAYELYAPSSCRKGEILQLEAWGKDRNGVFIADGEVQLIMLTTDISAMHDTLLRIPDTLWTHRHDLRPGEKTPIIVPDSIFPPASIHVRIDALFRNSNGELHKKSATVNYINQEYQHQPNARLWLEVGEVCGAYYGSGATPDTVAAKLIVSLPGGKETLHQAVTLPCRFPVNPAYRGYELLVNGKTAKLDLQGNSRVYVEGYRTADSLVWVLYNPLRLPVAYTVWQGKAIWERGVCTEDSLKWARQTHSAQTMAVQCHYTWAGEPQEIEETYARFDKLLRIKLDQPALVAPGETVQVKVEAKDFRNNPAKGVQLAAGGINSQFDSWGNYEEPQITYRNRKKAIVFGEFSADRLSRRSLQQPLSARWYHKLGLSDQLRYRMRFEGDGVYAEYTDAPADTFYQRVAQVAPYLVKNGQLQPVYLVYVNRKLVYSADVDDIPPYSFVGVEGKNTIVIRGRYAEYTLTDVVLKAGQKLELAIDVDRYAASAKALKVSVKSMPKEWTAFEKNILNQHTFILSGVLSGHVYYLWNDNSNIHFINSNLRGQTLRVGPFMPKNQLYLLKQNDFQSRFEFEPGFTYVISPNRERLYANTLYQSNKTYLLSEKLAPREPGDLLFHPAQVKARIPIIPRIQYTHTTYTHQPDQGKLHLEYGKTDDPVLKAVCWRGPDSVLQIYSGNTRKWSGLNPGKYTVYLVAESGYAYLERTIEIEPNSTLCMRWSGAEFTPDSTGAVTWPLLYQQKPEPDLSQQSSGWKYGGNCALTGTVLDASGEPLIGASVIAYRDNILMGGAVTDWDGNYWLGNLPAGIFDIEISYTGFTTQKTIGVNILDRVINHFDQVLETPDYALSEVVIVAYKVPLVERDNTVQGYSVTGIASLPTRNINAISATAAGLDSEDEVNVRGSRADATEYYIDGIREGTLPAMQFDLIQYRGNFKDEAFWQPNLVTDGKGEAYFTVTYPDNITAWNTYALGMDRRGRAGVAQKQVRALKKLVAQLAVPRFMLEGDSAVMVGKTLHIGDDSLAVATAFQLDGQLMGTQQAVVAQGRVDRALVVAPAAPDTLALRFGVQSATYTDGEERKIPVLPVGSLESNGVFQVLEADTAFTLTFDPAKGPVTLYAEGNILQQLLVDLDGLRNYPYGCNEQNASRLTALLLDKQLRKLLGQPFTGEQDIQRMVVTLRKAQKDNGSWGWWPQGEGNIRMTTYVLRALHLASQSGYTTEALEKGLRYLTGQTHLLKGDELLHALRLLSSVGQPLDYAHYLAPFDTVKQTLHDRLLVLCVRQEQKLPHSLDTLKKHEQRTLYGGSYWDKQGYDLWSGAVASTLMAYDIAREAKDTILCRRIRRYFLRERPYNGWRNTLESAQILRAILPDLMSEADTIATLASTLAINGEWVSLPYTKTITAGQPLRIEKGGLGPVCFTAYQQSFNPRPGRKADIYAVDTRLEQDGREVAELRQGKPARLVVTVEAGETSDYVMIEAPIPAGCSYLDKPQQNWWGPEVHREYWKHQVAIFCERLSAGSHSFVINLEPRFDGFYTLNPAKAEQMYFSVLYGRENLRQVRIAGE
ncbi:MAG: carboxypeptidase regulatory-like domain-containing protein [Saprospiraceae bacterium]|nr:carboxypeptidase regulatory-like domain-containing protein [Saprospiraceae bacterium]